MIQRPQVAGKFLVVDGKKYFIKGVTYGTFGLNADGEEYDRQKVDTDFSLMATAGINTVRVYTVPPRWLLDAALEHGLRVMVGLPWYQHVSFLDNRKRQASIVDRVRQGVRSCANHPAVLCYAVGNEIPSSIVRWHGASRIEQFLERLTLAVRAEDPGALVTYVNFPSTEYLALDFVDFMSFNVYLESRDSLERYLAKLQNLAGERPLVMAEIGLDSMRNGEDAQAETLAWQIQSIFSAGCAGAFIFAWTDEWHREGNEIEDWDFGLVTRDRAPKPALAAVSDAFAAAPFPLDQAWPAISVIVCSYNGARTLRDTLDGLARPTYPRVEIIVVDDGSTDETATIARDYDLRLIQIENGGLGAARNVGMRAATGEILAYTDDDARPDPDWLFYLAHTFMTSDVGAVGGPNIAPPGDGLIADAVANAPGGPVHVLTSDLEADHIPGCNFAIRKSVLEEIGGWDPRYRSAGDDVDVCWRLQDGGYRIGFSHGAMVWHHRRNSAKTYWKQQQGYGKAEALLEEKWPERYNALGHLSWSGRLYGRGLTRTIGLNSGRLYQGTWGTAPFQSLYEPAPGLIRSLPLMPEWWLGVAGLAALSLLSVWWSALLVAVPLLLLAIVAPIVQALISTQQARYTGETAGRLNDLKVRLWATGMHLAQPVARLRGRIRHGLTPWRRQLPGRWTLPIPRQTERWSEEWRSTEDWLTDVETSLRQAGVPVRRGGDYDGWDLEIRGGVLGGARLILALDEHGAGARFRAEPIYANLWTFGIILLGVVTILALMNGAIVAAIALGLVFLAFGIWAIIDTGQATWSLLKAAKGGGQ